MKPLNSLLLLILLFAFMNGKGQDTTAYFINGKGDKVEKEAAKYSRKVLKQNKQWLVWDYYLNGPLQMSAIYSDKKLTTKNGLKSSFYENGNPSSALNYTDGKLIGTSTWYFENGQKSAVEIYNSKGLVSFEFFDEKGNKLEGDLQPVEYPQFPGGADSLVFYLQKVLKYPPNALKNKTEGTVIVEFYIDTDGSVKGAKINKSIHPELDAEALRVVNSLPNFSIGKQHNRPVKVQNAIPIKFYNQ